MAHFLVFRILYTLLYILFVISDFEKRFVFHEDSEFPDPEKFLNTKKVYPSQVLNSKYNPNVDFFYLALGYFENDKHFDNF